MSILTFYSHVAFPPFFLFLQIRTVKLNQMISPEATLAVGVHVDDNSLHCDKEQRSVEQEIIDLLFTPWHKR